MPKTPTTVRTEPIQFYRDRNRNHRWRVRAGNGRIIATSGEGYERIRDCKRGLDRLFYALLTARKTQALKGQFFTSPSGHR